MIDGNVEQEVSGYRFQGTGFRVQVSGSRFQEARVRV